MPRLRFLIAVSALVTSCHAFLRPTGYRSFRAPRSFPRASVTPTEELATTAAPESASVVSRRSAGKHDGVGSQSFTYLQLSVPTGEGISVHDITPSIREALADAGVTEGVVNVVSQASNPSSPYKENSALTALTLSPTRLTGRNLTRDKGIQPQVIGSGGNP